VGDKLLIDGGIMDNVPVDVVRSMGAERLIVVNVGTPLAPAEKLSNPLALLNQMVGALMIDKTDHQIESLGADDILIQPVLGDLGSGDFKRANEAIEIGVAAAEGVLGRLRTLAAPPATWQQFAERHHQREFDPGLVAFLRVDETKTSSGEFVQR